MPRQARLDAPGTLHHIIIRGIERKKIVSDDHDREDFVKKLIRQSDHARKYQFSSYKRSQHAVSLIKNICKKEGITIDALISGSPEENEDAKIRKNQKV